MFGAHKDREPRDTLKQKTMKQYVRQIQQKYTEPSRQHTGVQEHKHSFINMTVQTVNSKVDIARLLVSGRVLHFWNCQQP